MEAGFSESDSLFSFVPLAPSFWIILGNLSICKNAPLSGPYTGDFLLLHTVVQGGAPQAQAEEAEDAQ